MPPLTSCAQASAVSPWVYAGFIALVLALLALDLGVFHRKAHAPTMRESVGWTAFWIVLALLFRWFEGAGRGPGGPPSGVGARRGRCEAGPCRRARVTAGALEAAGGRGACPGVESGGQRRS